MFVRKYPAVNEFLHLIDVSSKASESVYSSVFPMTYDAQEQVVRCDAVAACSHRFFAGKIDD